MSRYERILMECRYLLSLNKNYSDLATKFNLSIDDIYYDLNCELPKLDSILYKRVKKVLNKKKST